MKLLTFTKIMLFALVLFGFALNNFAQQPDIARTEQSAQKREVMGEDDRLPFMQNEQTPAENAEPTSGGLLLKTFGAMFLIVGLLFFAAWGLKKYGFGTLKTDAAANNAPVLKVLSSLSVSSGQTLSVVRFGEKTLLIGSTAQSFTLLADEINEEIVIPRQPPSVSALLAEENSSLLLAEENDAFGREFDDASSRLGEWQRGGGRI